MRFQYLLLGAASACREISPLRIKSMSDTLSDLITVSAINGDESSSIWQAYNQANTEGQRSITNRRQTCAAADRALADLEKTVTPSQAAVPGVGLGLTISNAIVTAHGGSIDVTSRAEVGTRFRVELPFESSRGQHRLSEMAA